MTIFGIFLIIALFHVLPNYHGITLNSKARGSIMTDQMLHTPDGVRDIYNGECKQKLLLQERLHDVLRQYGYRDIQTPTFEFLIFLEKKLVQHHPKICISF